MVELMAVSKVVFTLELVAKVLVGVGVGVGTGRGCVCGSKYWMVEVSSMVVMSSTMVVAPVEAIVIVFVSFGGVGMGARDGVAGEVRRQVGRR